LEEINERRKLVKMVGYQRGFRGVVAVDNVDFDLKRGEIYCLLEENGAGNYSDEYLIRGL
jgi:ABC-type sugar transport system ATPase subunit